MQSSRTVDTHIVLLGGGHAHLEVLRSFAKRPESGARLTLISREPQSLYSGMLPGLVRGDYTFQQTKIDLAPLAAAAGARLIVSEASGIDLEAHRVVTEGCPAVGFDLLSIDVGGQSPGSLGSGVGVKPIGRFLDHLRRLESGLPSGARVGVVGGGAAGVELVLALAVRFADRFPLVLVSASAEPIATAPSLARRAALRALIDAGVDLVCGSTAIGLQSGGLTLSDGRVLKVADAVWATGVQGPRFLVGSGLACDPAGCIQVASSLQSVSHAFVFAAGDCAAVEGSLRPKAGVWAVRAGAKVAENLRRAARRQSVIPWRPQRDALVILGLGRGRALAWRNGIVIQGRTVWRLKDALDRRWIRLHTEA